MKITTCKTETIIINNPSKSLLDLMNRAREHKRHRRESMGDVSPMFTIKA